MGVESETTGDSMTAMALMLLLYPRVGLGFWTTLLGHTWQRAISIMFGYQTGGVVLRFTNFYGIWFCSWQGCSPPGVLMSWTGRAHSNDVLFWSGVVLKGRDFMSWNVGKGS